MAKPGNPCRANRGKAASDDAGAQPNGRQATDSLASSPPGKTSAQSAPPPAPRQRSRHERVGEGEDGQRLDNFLIRRSPGVPKSHLYRLIRTGEVRVDGKRVKQTRKLGVGEQVRIPGMAVQPKTAARVPDKLADTLAAGIVHEQEDFIVVAKPPGVAVHAGTGVDFGVIDALRQKLDAPALELVHRLDRGTSGALLVARDKGRNRALQQLFRQRSVEKRYLALAACRWPGESTVVDAPLLKNTEHAGERRVIVDQAGQSALTRFSVQERFSEATLLDVLIETGRTHQIRVHARHIACALVGDTRYGDNACNARFRRLGLGRLFLHAARLSFQWQGKAFTIEVPPDDSWEAALETLRRATRKISRPR